MLARPDVAMVVSFLSRRSASIALIRLSMLRIRIVPHHLETHEEYQDVESLTSNTDSFPDPLQTTLSAFP